MYLSGVPLSLIKKDALHGLSAYNLFHNALYMFKERPLWRIDKIGDQLYILILSKDKADLSTFCRHFGVSEFAWKTKSYESLLERLKENTLWRFRLTANPVKRLEKQVIALTNWDAQKQWLLKQSQKHGFFLYDFYAKQKEWKIFTKRDGNRVSIFSVTYEGVLKIIDLEKFRKALTEGIGREKAYGMGLLTVIQC